MTDKEKLKAIKAEIERRLEELNPKKGEWMGKPLRDVNPRTFPRESELEKLLAFIDSLPEESASEDLEEAARRYVTPPCALGIKTFKAGVKWQREQMMAKALDVEVKEDCGGYPYIPQMELYDYDKDIPLAKDGDKYKVILIKED